MSIDVKTMTADAKKATFAMGRATTEKKNKALETLIENLKEHQEVLLSANQRDIANAKVSGLSVHLLERLSLENRLAGIIHDIGQVIELCDPIGEVFEEQILPNQLKLAKTRTPLGVLGVIYESRPNVTLDISVLAIKSGNCAILRGGSEAFHTNLALIEIIQRALIRANLPKEAVQLIANTDRSTVKELLQQHEYVDLIIPRGSSALQQFCLEHSTIPVVTGGIGICHLFVDETADLQASLKVIVNAKTQRPTVCNALDTLLVHASVASYFISEVIKTLGKEGVTFRLDSKAWEFAQEPGCRLAESCDWDTEWLSLVLGIKVVEGLDEAIEHIHRHSTGHSDGILTEDHQQAERFIAAIDSAVVYVNASTRFTDGGQFGFGAEVAISTQKMHARGPMGLKELTSYKWVIHGNYQVRQ